MAAGLPVLAQVDAPRLAPADANVVLVDVVVRDGKGRLVTDLQATDFAVLEDGVLQVVGQFDPPRGSLALPAEPAAQAATADEPTRASPDLRPGDTVAFVFDQLSASGRVAAQKAAKAHLAKGSLGTAGVFSIEDTLVILQEFTSDRELLAAALDALGTRIAHAGSSHMDQQRALVAGRLNANQAQQILSRTPDPGKGGDAATYASAKMNAMRAFVAQAAEDAFNRLARDAHGFVTANALTAITDALRTVPGPSCSSPEASTARRAPNAGSSPSSTRPTARPWPSMPSRRTDFRRSRSNT